MSLDNPFAKHRQCVWRERAADTDLPLWQRIAFLAYGSHRRNGHANFGPGELSSLLDKPAARISRALRQARDKGWLAGESSSRCLVVPPHAVEGGLGHPGEACAVHTGKRTGRRRAPVFRLPEVAKTFPGGQVAELAHHTDREDADVSIA